MDVVKICNFIREVYGAKNTEIVPLHTPKFIGNEKAYLNDCIDSTFVSSVGKYVDKFEKDIAKICGSKYAIACVNGTSALHICLLLSGVERDSEVITQPLSFIATSNAISYTGAKIVYVDVDIDTMGLSPIALEQFLESNCQIREINNIAQCYNKTSNRIIKAVVPMHTFGHPCKIDEIANICKKWHLALVEDAAESLGSYYKNIHTGNTGVLSALSFNGNKIVTSGGGGAILTNDEILAKKAKHITTTAKIPHKYEYVHDMIGYNYRMPNINAALLVAQLENLDIFLSNKRELSKIYKDFFSNMDDVKYIIEPKYAKSNYWLQAIMLDDKKQRNEFLEYSNNNGVMTRPIWRLNNNLDMYKYAQCGDLSNCQELESRIVNIPSSARL